ncbi:helix-turn-helix domain-containing protein [Prauserella marina]|uniref:helix-turn-helix domain-containing protein n=1 Tax=Prauserella marina TaxID=530584 RepID=UPI001475078A|nr:helix-turn-helix transcriptional regulator [Prauserella marina]
MIGQRVRTIRRRRGLSQAVIAGHAQITKQYLSLLEKGERRFERRGLLEDLADALGCSVADLTGQPYLPHDRASAEALATLPPISVALAECTLDDAPDLPARPLHVLEHLTRTANIHSADSRYTIAGHALGDLLTELHIHAATTRGDARRRALAALTEACIVACGSARSLGNIDLAIASARRGQDAAALLNSPALAGFAGMSAAGALSRLGARRRAQWVSDTALADVAEADPSADDTTAAEAAGMLHLSAAMTAAKNHQAGEAIARLQVAEELAAVTGEKNTLCYSFGPANAMAWSLSIAVELGSGPERAEVITRQPGYDSRLTTADRRAALHFDLARGYAQAEGARDRQAVVHLDTADRIAPQRIRHDPVARELVTQLDTRATRPSWELTSLRHRLGATAPG